MRPLVFFLAWVCLPAFSAAPLLAGQDLVLAELEKSLGDISSISGNFVQSKKMEFLNEPLVSRGSFYFARPGYLKWEYLSPAPSALIIDGEKAEAWAGPAGRRNRQPEAMAEAARLAAAQVMIWMNLDPTAISAAYEVSVTAEKPLRLKVVPKRSGARKFLKGLEVEFNPDRRTVRQVILHEAESRTTLTFERVSLNRPRPAAD